jgi:hypothetical protein
MSVLTQPAACAFPRMPRLVTGSGRLCRRDAAGRVCFSYNACAGTPDAGGRPSPEGRDDRLLFIQKRAAQRGGVGIAVLSPSAGSAI